MRFSAMNVNADQCHPLKYSISLPSFCSVKPTFFYAYKESIYVEIRGFVLLIWDRPNTLYNIFTHAQNHPISAFERNEGVEVQK